MNEKNSNPAGGNNKFYLIAGAVILIVVVSVWLGSSGPETPVSVNPDNLPGIQTGNAPWPPELDHLRERLGDIGLPVLSEEGSALHIHEHLDIFVDGKPVAIPAGIGVNEKSGFISPIHTHDPDAIIHVESPTKQTFTLGQFFDIWGVKFTNQCVGGYCSAGDKTLKVYVNGNLVGGDPRKVELGERQEIVVTYGTSGELPNPIPSTYAFPADL